MEVLGEVVQHDFYHLPQYHRIEEGRLQAAAHLFAYREDGYLIALPLLLRPVGEGAEGWNDATSVYGYCGPVASHEMIPEPVIRNFQVALRRELAKRHVVAVFSALHSVISQRGLLAGLGECPVIGQTVSIDLTLPPESQRAQYRYTCKRRINGQHRKGIVCIHDLEKRYLSEFNSIYEATMRRVNATADYFFGADYFFQLVRELGSTLQLFVVLIEDKVAAAGLVTIHGGVVQYHLGGTRVEFLKFSPMTFLFETVRLWANEVGARIVHLGGGVGAKADSLFHFKAGFSDRRHDFAVWRWIVEPEIYRKLCQQRSRMNELQGLEPAATDYFPAYRCPTVTRAPAKPIGVKTDHTEARIYHARF